MEWGGGRASRVRILSREKEGISEGELRGETKKEELREEERWLGDFFFSRRPSWRRSSSDMVIMVFLCTFVLHICYISSLMIPTLFVRLHCFDVYWFNI